MKRAVFFGLLAASATGLMFACGARTGLLVPDQLFADTGPDVHRKKDVGPDVEDEPDVFQGIDATELDAYRNDCPDAGSTLVYVVSDNYQLLSFYPPDATFTLIGSLKCPANPSTATPFSMAVDRHGGTAFVVYNDGELFKVSTTDASCQATTFVRNQMGFTTFGMGFATIGTGPAEDLFIAADLTAYSELGTIDTMTYKVASVGPLNVMRPELSGTGDGRLFAFSSTGADSSAVSEVDKATGNILGTDALGGVGQGNGWAFAFWGGDFYLFTGPGGTQNTWKYDPVSKTATLLTHYSSLIVGAGVSTCAPQ